jgi:hypothetical protein
MRLVGLPSRAPDVFRTANAALVLGDQPPFLLGQGGKEVKHERVSVAAEFGDDERYALRHQAGDERNVARQSAEL